MFFSALNDFAMFFLNITKTSKCFLGLQASSVSSPEVEEQPEVEVVKGYTMSQICDRMIDLFLNEKTKSKEWRKYLVFREEWKKYRDGFYRRCQRRADMENDPVMKQKLISLWKKMKKVKQHSQIFCVYTSCNVGC